MALKDKLSHLMPRVPFKGTWSAGLTGKQELHCHLAGFLKQQSKAKLTWASLLASL